MSVTKSDIMLLETYLIENFWRMRPELRYVRENNVVGVMFKWGSNSIKLNMDDIEPLLEVMDPESGYSHDSKKFLRELLFPFILEHANK